MERAARELWIGGRIQATRHCAKLQWFCTLTVSIASVSVWAYSQSQTRRSSFQRWKILSRSSSRRSRHGWGSSKMQRRRVCWSTWRWPLRKIETTESQTRMQDTEASWVHLRARGQETSRQLLHQLLTSGTETLVWLEKSTRSITGRDSVEARVRLGILEDALGQTFSRRTIQAWTF